MRLITRTAIAGGLSAAIAFGGAPELSEIFAEKRDRQVEGCAAELGNIAIKRNRLPRACRSFNESMTTYQYILPPRKDFLKEQKAEE